MKQLVVLVVLTLSLMATASAQRVAIKKPYTEWTPEEVSRILFNSQWTQDSVQFGNLEIYRPNSPDEPAGTKYLVQIRLSSALPVRQAVVRRMQLNIPYEKLNSAQRASYDAEVNGLLNCPQCSEYYIVTVRSASKDRLDLISRGGNVTLDIIEILKGLPEDELLRHVSLVNDKGERRDAARVMFTKGHEVLFLFRRSDEQGHPLITTSNKKFYVDFDKYVAKKAEGALKKFTFNVGDMVRDGEVDF